MPLTTKPKNKQWSEVTNLPVPHDKEYNTLRSFGHKQLAELFDTLSVALDNNTWEMLDIDSVEATFIEVFSQMRIVKRFRTLHQINGSVSYSDDCLLVDDHEFQTLDEIEKALKNKAFL